MEKDFEYNGVNYRVKDLEDGMITVLQCEFDKIVNGDTVFTDWVVACVVSLSELETLWLDKGMNYGEIADHFFKRYTTNEWNIISYIIDQTI